MNSIALEHEKTLYVETLAKEWKSQFDILPDIALNFSLKQGELYLNGETVLCPLELIDMESSFYDVESITLALLTGDCVIIHMIWPAHGDIKVHVEQRPDREATSRED